MGFRMVTTDHTTVENPALFVDNSVPLTLDDMTPDQITEAFILVDEEVKNVHKSAPRGKPSSRSAYADPDNYKWPIDARHIRAAVGYYNHGNKSGYSESQWASIGRKIAAAANRLIGPGHKYANGRIQTADDAADEEFLVLALGKDDLTVTVEEITVSGVPCYQIEAMVIPGDAVSKNTVPGKRGPTYYSNRRVRQYAQENNRIIEEMNAKGQRVTIYPRHAAALLDASLPMGWVDGYEVRPSRRGGGLEDVWYRATIPLTNEGRDAWMKLRTGLVKYSSLRTFADGRFTTEPVKMNGQTVEEATSLPIAGIDLVATQPGLPVDPIRVLEEAAAVEPAVEEPMSAPMPPQRQQPQQQQQMQGQQQQQQQQPQQQQPQRGNVPQQYATCPNCGADLTFHVEAAHAAMNASSQQQQQQPQQGGQQQQPGQGQAPQRTAREEELEAQVSTLSEALGVATAELEARNTMPETQQQPSAVEGDGDLAKDLELANAKVEMLQAQLEASKAALEEVQQFVAAAKAEKAINAKVEELIASDATLGPILRPQIMAAIVEENLSDPRDIEIRYLRLHAVESNKRSVASSSRSRIPGFGHVNLTAVEEAQGSAGSAQTTQGKAVADPADAAVASKKDEAPGAAMMRQIFARTGGGKSTWDA